MGLFDKVKETLSNTMAELEAKKAADEQHKLEMKQRSADRAQEIINAITDYENNGSFFGDIDFNALKAFTKDFYDKIFMPANSVSQSKISMYPYITDKQISKIKAGWTDFGASETVLIHIKAQNKQDIVITDAALYFHLVLAEDPKYYADGKIPCEQISRFTIVKNEATFDFLCDEYVLASFAIDKSTSEDLITLNNYFTCIANKDFEITDEEVDKLIQEKIGEKVYAEVKKYFVFDDELMVYFAWGCDSLAAKDYIVCTNKQIITINREMFGATANIKQYYYEDITSANTLQNSNSNDLTSFLIDTALTAALQTCDLVITVAGAQNKISNIYKVEAERIVAVYHQYRKMIKSAAEQPRVVMQQAPVEAESPLEQLKKLSQLKELGIITEDEFNEKKAQLLAKI